MDEGGGQPAWRLLGWQGLCFRSETLGIPRLMETHHCLSPDGGNPHVRWDGGGQETGPVRAPAPARYPIEIEQIGIYFCLQRLHTEPQEVEGAGLQRVWLGGQVEGGLAIRSAGNDPVLDQGTELSQ